MPGCHPPVALGWHPWTASMENCSHQVTGLTQWLDGGSWGRCVVVVTGCDGIGWVIYTPRSIVDTTKRLWKLPGWCEASDLFVHLLLDYYCELPGPSIIWQCSCFEALNAWGSRLRTEWICQSLIHCQAIATKVGAMDREVRCVDFCTQPHGCESIPMMIHNALNNFPKKTPSVHSWYVQWRQALTFVYTSVCTSQLCSYCNTRRMRMLLLLILDAPSAANLLLCTFQVVYASTHGVQWSQLGPEGRVAHHLQDGWWSLDSFRIICVRILVWIFIGTTSGIYCLNGWPSKDKPS